MKDVSKTFKFSPTANIVFLLIALSSLLYTVLNRPINDFWKFSSYITISILGLLFIFFLILFIKNRSVQQFKKVRIKFFIIIILILFLGPIYYSIGVVVSDIFLFFLKRDILKIWNIPLVVLIITLLGLGLFYFRLYLRCIYGFTEAVIGVFIAIDKIDFPIDYDLTFLAILAGSLFLVVRGYDNMHQGYINEKDPVVKRIFEFFRQNGI